MTDFTPEPVAPIVVNATPATDQAQALLRQVLVGLGFIAGAVGLAKWSGELNLLASLAGPIVTVGFSAVGLGALIWGQIKTRVLSKKAAAMANMLPSHLAQTK